MTLLGESLTSRVITLTPILAQILTSDPYNCWPLLSRKSVFITTDVHLKSSFPSIVVNFDRANIVKKEICLCYELHSSHSYACVVLSYLNDVDNEIECDLVAGS